MEKAIVGFQLLKARFDRALDRNSQPAGESPSSGSRLAVSGSRICL